MARKIQARLFAAVATSAFALAVPADRGSAQSGEADLSLSASWFPGEAGAMMAMSPGVLLQAKMEGGFLKSMKRGDLLSLDVSPQMPLVIQKGSWLASSHGVELDTQWGGFKNLLGSEGGFVLHATGAGPVVVGCYGALETWDLAAGQTITVSRYGR